MGNIWYWILGLYVLPMVINILFVYSDNKFVHTVGDLLKFWWAYFVPFLNIFMTLCLPIYCIDVYFKLGERWEKFKNIKIR